jgi:hypothetical protein
MYKVTNVINSPSPLIPLPKGCVANLTETCDPQNEIQLITKVQVAPNMVFPRFPICGLLRY